MSKKFDVCDFFKENEVVHCAALAITKNILKTERGPVLPQPSDDLINGTITFFEYEGKTYGVTCLHVVEILRDIEKKLGEGSHSMRTMLNGFFVVNDRFVGPRVELGQDQPDIVIREVMPEFVKKIGKKPINLDSAIDTPLGLDYAIAIGFPTLLKYKREVGAGEVVSMPHTTIVAELSNGTPVRRFSMFSELDEEPKITDFSGASGGPIFWSTADEYGILGIIYEGGSSKSFGECGVNVMGELATPNIIKDWIAEYCRVNA